MPHYVAANCRNRTFLKSKKQEELQQSTKITFHRFPKNEERRLAWIKAMGLDPSTLPKDPALCSLHFCKEDFYHTTNLTKLKQNTLPIERMYEVVDEQDLLEEPLQVPISDEFVESTSHDLSNAQHSLKTSIFYELVATIISATALAIICTSKPKERNEEIEEGVQPIANEGIIEAEMIETEINFETSPSTELSRKRYREEEINDYNISRKKRCCSKLDSEYQPVDETPRKTMLRKTMKQQKTYYEKKIRLLSAKMTYQKSRITKLNTMMKALKKEHLLSVEQAEMLDDIRKSNIPLFQRFLAESQLKRKKEKRKVCNTLNTDDITQTTRHISRKKYDPLIRRFALSLHFYSPRGYNYVREQFQLCLPHPKSISRWYRSLDGNPGFLQEAFRSIKCRAKNTDHPLVGTIVFDEMSIRHCSDIGATNTGYVDYGEGIEQDSTCVATQALVFMFVCMNGYWKIPLGYFLVAGVSADQKANLLEQCLILLHDTGVGVVAVTCDGVSVNFSMFKLLGCNFKLKSFRTWFYHPITKKKVYAIMYACHMIKLIRNTFGSVLELIDGLTNTIIRWKYILQLHKLQNREFSHIVNKLRVGHVQFWKQKMKVRFATQLLSKSVAESLQICNKVFNLTEFKGCSSTEKFVLIFNDLFDIFNSKNMFQFGFKQPINPHNYTTIINKLEECKTYIQKLQLVDGTEIINSTRKTGFLGFLINIESLKGLYQELCVVEKILTYIPTYKLSQDHVELFFGCIRSKGGYNNNPSASNFKSAMKELLVQLDIKASTKGNCIPLEQIHILHVTSKNQEEMINSSTVCKLRDNELHIINPATVSNLQNNDEEEQWNNRLSSMLDHDYIQDIPVLSEIGTHIVVYIAGYIVYSLKKTLYCEECINALIADNDDDEYTSIVRVKSRGKLHYPSFSVKKICVQGEKIIRFAIAESGGIRLKAKYTEPYLVSRVLSYFCDTNILFLDLIEHSYDIEPLENHVSHLIKLIALKYIKIRLHYICKLANQQNVSKRTFRNHLTLYEGQ